MGAADRTVAGALCGLALLGVLSGCASTPKSPAQEAALPSQTVVPPPTPDDSTAGAAASAAAAAQANPAAAASSPPAKDPTLVVIDSVQPKAAAQPETLAAVAARERQRRREGDKPSVVINNQNLAGYASGGVLTVAQDDPRKGATAGAAAKDGEAEGGANESYWRQRGLEIRKRWRDAVDRIPTLQNRAEELRQRFYSTDDPAIRDGQIKPDWDRVLADLDQARYQAARGAEEVVSFLDEGRRAGALPGWLREGAELEPEPVLETTDGTQPLNEPKEPSVYTEPPAEPPPGADA